MLTKENVQDVYPLAPMQEGMLIESLRDPDASAYVEQFDLRLEGPLDVAALEGAFAALVGKYSALRTLFSYRKTDQPRQVVLRRREAGIVHVDLAGEADPAIALAQFKEEDRRRGFDLSADVLLRATLVRLATERHSLVLSFHHIILDGWSFGPLFGDLFAAYAQLRSTPGAALAETEPHPYGEYVRWVLAQDREAAQRHFETYLAGYDGDAAPPYANRRRSEAIDHAEHVFLVPEALSARLNAVARERRLTLNSVFQTAWGVLLQKYNHCDDVVFGSVVSGRPPALSGVENMVGLFINTQPLRVRCTGDDAFSAVAAGVQQAFFANSAYDYQPLSAVQAVSIPKQRLVNHVVTFENLPIQEQMGRFNAHGGDLRVVDVEVFQAAKFDFHVVVNPGDALRVAFVYNAGRYTSAEIETCARSLLHLLSRIADAPDASISTFSVCALDDVARVLQAFNATARPYPVDGNVPQLFRETARAYPDALAVREGARALSYRQLGAGADALSIRLQALGVAPGARVALRAPRGIAMTIGALAVLQCGAAYVPIDGAATPERLRFMLDDCDVRVLLTVPAHRDRTPQGVTELVLEDAVIDAHIAAPDGMHTDDAAVFALPSIPAEAPAYVMYTSGSTGQPKGCEVLHRNIVRLVRNTDFATLGPDERILQTGAPGFDASTLEIWGALLNGGELHLIDEYAILDAARLRAALSERRITLLWLTSALFNQLCDDDPALFAPLRQLIVGGDVLSPRHIAKVRAANLGLRVVNGYGPTENTTFSATFAIEADYPDCIPVGRPIANSTAYVLDMHGKLLPPGACGELCVGGDGVAAGYVGRADLTAEKFVVDPFRTGGRMYRTGDIARWREDGTLELLGRNDGQVKIRGFRVELGEIERALVEISGASDAAVAVHEGPSGKQLHAFYVADHDLDPQQLRGPLGARLPSYMLPAHLLRVDRLPLTANGKLDRRALPFERSLAQRAQVRVVEARSATERTVASIVREVLGRDDVGLHENFFEAGGDSISLMTVAKRLKDSFDQEVPLAMLFEYTTIARIAEYLHKQDDGDDRAREDEALAQSRNALLKTRNLMKALEET